MNKNIFKTILSLVIGFMFGTAIGELFIGEGGSPVWWLPFMVGVFWFIYLGVDLGTDLKRLKRKREREQRQQLND